jgi:AraC-like DNA-binding protein/quercetin dioxygenase-like cupin family protein
MKLVGVQAVVANECAARPQDAEYLGQQAGLQHPGGDMVEHRERRRRVKGSVVEPEGGRIAVPDLHICVREAPRERIGSRLVTFDRHEATDPRAQPVGGRAWTGAELQQLLAERDAGGDRREDVAVQMLRPLGTGTEPGVVLVHVITVSPGSYFLKSVWFQAMSPNGQVGPGPDTGAAAILLSTFPMESGKRFSWHSHDRHQLAWAADGVLTIVAETHTWVLPPTRALWIPAGVVHETIASEKATMRTLYLKPGLCPIAWAAPQPVAATRLLAELIMYLSDAPLKPAERSRAEAVLLDLLQPVATTTIEVAMPTDERALDVARGLLADPADGRSLAEWGRAVGASGRTLTRAFLAGTGIPFSRWRTAVRLRAALPHLASGEPIGVVADRVGYQTPSAFVAAFRRETGLTPGAYFRSS